MRTWTLIAAGLLVGALLIPGGSAQTAGVTLSFETPAGPLPHNASSELPFTATINCVGVLSSGGSTDVVIATDNAPAYLGIQNKTVSFTNTDCLNPSGSVDVSDSLTMTPTADAPGMSTMEVTFTASHAGASDSATIPITLDYKMGYTWSTDISFPYELAEDSVTFNITLMVDTNAVTMVMFETVEAPLGILTPPFPYTFNDPMAQNTHVVEVTYQAPVGAWTNDTATLKTWSHFLDDGGLKTPDEQMVFTFTRAAGTSANGGDDKDSPGIALPGLLALLGAALYVARRRS